MVLKYRVFPKLYSHCFLLCNKMAFWQIPQPNQLKRTSLPDFRIFRVSIC
jgi:hypothetical protein